MNDWIESLPPDKVGVWIAANGDKACAIHMTTDPHFALWLHYLDRACMRWVWLSYRDLDDWDYRAAYDAGMSPAEACVYMLVDNGYDEYEENL